MQIRTRRRRIKKISRRQRSVSRRRSSSRNGGSRQNPLSQFNRSPRSSYGRQSSGTSTRYTQQTHHASMQNEEQYANLAEKIVNDSPQIKNELLSKLKLNSDGEISDDFTPQQVLGMLPSRYQKLNVKLLLYMIILFVVQGADARRLRIKVPTPAIDKWLDSLGGPRIDTTGKKWDFWSQRWVPDPKFRATGVEFNPAGYLQPTQTHMPSGKASAKARIR